MSTIDFTQSPTLSLSDSTTSVTRSFRGFTGYILAQGDFKTGTLSLDISVDGGITWVPYPTNLLPSGTPLTWTSAGLAKVDLPYCLLRFSVTGADAGLDVDIYIW